MGGEPHKFRKVPIEFNDIGANRFEHKTLIPLNPSSTRRYSLASQAFRIWSSNSGAMEHLRFLRFKLGLSDTATVQKLFEFREFCVLVPSSECAP
jgi:hypothetical protein